MNTKSVKYQQNEKDKLVLKVFVLFMKRVCE